MDKKNIIILILALIILIGVSFMGYNYLADKNYRGGFVDAQTQINAQVIKSLDEKGFITVYVPYNETASYALKLVPEQQNTVE